MSNSAVFGPGLRHFLTGEELSMDGLQALLRLAASLKAERQARKLRQDLAGQNVTLVFEKPSLRTHLSFSIAIQELGGSVVESFSSIRKKEEPEDVAGVLSGYSHAMMVRTHEHSILERMASKSRIPIINGLTDSHHPCQILADLLTLQETHGGGSPSGLRGLTLTYIGDGNNILHSLLLLLPYAGVNVRYACPPGYQPEALILQSAKARALEGGATITALASPAEAVKGAHAIYTDVWTSMGFEDEVGEREAAFQGYQVNAELYSHALPGAAILHCMPMIRGKEITDEMADHECSALFRQSENRLHVQKALLLSLLGGGASA